MAGLIYIYYMVLCELNLLFLNQGELDLSKSARHLWRNGALHFPLQIADIILSSIRFGQ